MADPFNKLIEAIREEGKFYNEPSFYFAKVTSKLPNLKVMLGDIELDKRNLLIDKWLLDRNDIENKLKTEKEGHQQGGDTTGNGEHLHYIKEPIKDILDIGDRVVMLKNNDKFIIISKVVNV